MTPLIFFEFGEASDAESGFQSESVVVNEPVAATTPIELRSKGKTATEMALHAPCKNSRRLLLFIRANPDVASVTYEAASIQQSH
jgi:hypothetical protein